MSSSKIEFIDYLNLFVRWRKYIIINFLIICVLAAGISLILPKIYRASSTIYPSAQSEGGLGISSLLTNLPISDLSLGGGMSEDANMLLAILDSRSMMESRGPSIQLAGALWHGKYGRNRANPAR